jgi:hypothetical protein
MLPKEVEISYSELPRLAEGVMNTFIQRRDLYARQLDDGRYVCVQKPLTINHILAHLRGDLTLGAYILDPSSQARFVVFDADEDAQFQGLISAATHLEQAGSPAYLEASRRGGHLWLFLPCPVSGQIARDFGAGFAKKFGLDRMEMFPKQAHLKDGPGSLIRLPFGIHRRTGQRYGFVSPSLVPLAPTLADQIDLLSSPNQIPDRMIDQYRSIKPEAPEVKPVLISHNTEGTVLSERIKNCISAYDFISKYVHLTENGRGLCPFHEDKVHSFAVNANRNYWHCFAGCGGGSIIDFWMKWRNCDFSTAVRELARLLL